MEYDPIKDRFGSLIDSYPRCLPILFGILDSLFLRTWYVHRVLQKLKLGSGARLLDAGTGFGQYAWHVLRKYSGVSVTGIDIKKDYLERADRCFRVFGLSDRVELLVDDVTKPQVKGAFDCILAVDILEHIEADEVAIGHFSQRLLPGGRLVISTPSDQGGSDVKADGQSSFIGEHVRDGYNLGELTRKLEHAGLKIEESHYSYGPIGSAAWRMLIKLPLLLLGRSLLLMPLVALYYIPVLPLGLLMNAMDLFRDNDAGTGLIVVARRET